MNSTQAKRIGKVVSLVVVGCVMGSLVGIGFGFLFAELFRDVLVEAAPVRNVAQQIENAGIELYSYLFIGFGWLAGFIVGGVTGLFFAQEPHNA